MGSGAPVRGSGPQEPDTRCPQGCPIPITYRAVDETPRPEGGSSLPGPAGDTRNTGGRAVAGLESDPGLPPAARPSSLFPFLDFYSSYFLKIALLRYNFYFIKFTHFKRTI